MADQTPEQVIAALQEQLAVLQKTHDETVNTANEQTAALQGQLSDLQAKHDELEATSATEISALSTQLASATKAASLGYVAVTVGEKQYKIVGKKFQIGDKIITAAELANDQKQLQRLIDIGSGIVQEIAA